MAPTKNSSPSSSDASRLLTKGFRFLRFDEPLETEFRAEHRARLRVWCRIAIIVSACTVVGFAILDHFVLSPEHSRITNLVRFGLHVPCVLIMLLLTSKQFYTRWYELGISFIAPMFGIGTVIMSASNTRVTDAAGPLVTQSDPLSIAGCPFTPWETLGSSAVAEQRDGARDRSTQAAAALSRW